MLPSRYLRCPCCYQGAAIWGKRCCCVRNATNKHSGPRWSREENTTAARISRRAHTYTEARVDGFPMRLMTAHHDQPTSCLSDCTGAARWQHVSRQVRCAAHHVHMHVQRNLPCTTQPWLQSGTITGRFKSCYEHQSMCSVRDKTLLCPLFACVKNCHVWNA